MVCHCNHLANDSSIPSEKVRLPNGLKLRGRRPDNANLDDWSGISHRLPNHNSTRWPRRGLRNGITCEPGQLISYTLFLFSAAGGGGRKSTVLALRLGRGTDARWESVNHHFLPYYHLSILMVLGYFWLNWLGWSL